MPNYKVMTDRCSLGKQGATISGDDLEGVNVAALVEGGLAGPRGVAADGGGGAGEEGEESDGLVHCFVVCR